MTHEFGSTESKGKRTTVWMIVAIVAIVAALVAGYMAFTYKQQVSDWEAAAEETLATLGAAGIEVQDTIVSGVKDYEDQIAGLSGDLEDAQTEAGIAQAQASEAEQGQATTKQELETTQQELETTQADLETTQASLADAEAQLQALGELVLPDGTYVGPVLAARSEPFPAIIFDQEGTWRVAEVAGEATITSAGQEFTIDEFSALLLSTDPADVELANGEYQVKVKDGLVTSIRKSEA